MLNKIIIHQLELQAIVGVYEHERKAKQALYLDLEICFDMAKAVQSDSVVDTIDYDEVVKQIQRTVSSTHFHLIESMAVCIADLILTNFPAQKVWCTVFKPNAIPQAKNVGISVERENTYGR